MQKSDGATHRGIYLLDAWYMAAWSETVDAALKPITLLDTPVVLFRTSDGEVRALLDECPHRFAPLSSGKLDGDTVVCGYHGLRFAGSGECVDPRFTEINRTRACVRSFPVIERDAMIWIWMGDADRLDPAGIPDFSFFSDPGRSSFFGYTHVKANYQLETDNLMDLSHLDYVHVGTIGAGATLQGKHSVVQEGRTVHSCWTCNGIECPPQLVPFLQPGDAKVDHWMDMRWDAPALLRLDTGATLAGKPRQDGFFSLQAHFATPETEHTTHYFWGLSVPGPANAMHDVVNAAVRQAFEEEDRPMIESVQQRMGTNEFWAKQPLILAEDAGAIRARRLLDQLIQAECRATE